MGTDIHLQVEAKINGEWVWLNEHLPKGIDASDYVPFPTERNYNLFSILADVRNGYGFAGCDTGDGFVPISKPKGLPHDMSKSLTLAHEEDGLLGDHSFSWLCADELKNYNWDRKTKKRGWVKKKAYEEFRIKGVPDEWCGGVSGPDVKYVTNQEMAELWADHENCYTQVEWEVSYKDAVSFDTYWKYSEFCSLRHWNEDGKKIQDMRIVFGFDS